MATPSACNKQPNAVASATSEIASLNGIRAVAVMLVFFSHGGMGEIIPGGLGVTVFFVLSGFLITTLMRLEYHSHGGIDLRAFYVRRVLRLMPPLLVVVALAALLSSLNLIDGAFSPLGMLSVLFYFGNYHIIATDFAGIPAGIGVVWSLAVEEHFYLLYPPLALALLRTDQLWLTRATLVVLCVAILGWRIWLASQGASDAHISMSTDTRADAILIGCLLAFWRNPAMQVIAAPIPPGHVLRDALIALACVLVLVATLIYRDEFFRQGARYTVQSLAIAPLIRLSIVRAAQVPFRWLNTRPMVYIGTISYSIYLLHQLVLFGILRASPQLDGFPALMLTAVLVLAIAEPIRRWIEQPCARLRRALHRRRMASTSSVRNKGRAVIQ
ncbi:MAG: acyltransferase [Pseudomonadota bacterium]|nr:acyltransferase [Pseudomonadota bacterium]